MSLSSEPDFTQKLLRYLELRIRYEFLQSRTRVAPVLAAVLTSGVVGLVLGLAGVLASVGLALAVDALTGVAGVGFAGVASAYGLVGWVLWRRRAQIQALLRARLDALIDHTLDEPPAPSDSPLASDEPPRIKAPSDPRPIGAAERQPRSRTDSPRSA